MRISLVMAVLDGARFLHQALGSVAAQTRPPDEIVVVDGGSTDGSIEIAQSFPGVRVIPQARSTGFAGAWDEGIAAADGELIALLDSDDQWTLRKLELQEAALARRPEVGHVVGLVRHFLEPGYPMPAGLRPKILGQDRVAHMPGAVLVRRGAYERVGPWGGDYTIAADIDWFARAKDLLPPPVVLDELLILKRFHDTNVSLFKARALNAELLSLLRGSLARRR
jgi:glycosyltransferase involved in cell wall biosynthesis